LQGQRKPVFEEIQSKGHTTQVLKGWEQITPGKMSPIAYDSAVGDLVNYMQWMADPTQSTRIRVGVWVMLYLLVFFVIAWRLNAAYWKDIR
jgi:ubiquinol-cytochrome c reductase cytochrome c1 subunit